jgi:hypothetical protein
MRETIITFEIGFNSYKQTITSIIKAGALTIRYRGRNKEVENCARIHIRIPGTNVHKRRGYTICDLSFGFCKKDSTISAYIKNENGLTSNLKLENVSYPKVIKLGIVMRLINVGFGIQKA